MLPPSQIPALAAKIEWNDVDSVEKFMFILNESIIWLMQFAI